LEYEPERYTSFDAYGAQQSGKHIGGALSAGHPGLAIAAGVVAAAKLAFKEFKRARPWKCSSCGRRSG
jgi:hypothetical protein